MMISNYHTHTYRCHHAEGTEREYIEQAIAAGLEEIGIADHCPYRFQVIGHPEYYSSHRMRPEELPEYIQSLQDLRAEYANRIRVRIGLEVEYFPVLFADFLELIRPYEVEYLILGQHALGNEYRDVGTSKPTADEETLVRYVDQVCQGMRTGAFTYLAHPEMMFYTGPEEILYSHLRNLCACSKETDTPLEINFLGLRAKRHYPKEPFWAMAGEMGCKVVFGCDAHEPAHLHDTASLAIAEEWCRKYNLERIVRPTFRNPKDIPLFK